MMPVQGVIAVSIVLYSIDLSKLGTNSGSPMNSTTDNNHWKNIIVLSKRRRRTNRIMVILIGLETKAVVGV